MCYTSAGLIAARTTGKVWRVHGFGQYCNKDVGFLSTLRLEGATGWEKLALASFFFTSFQAAFLVPYVVLVQGERANLFTALLGLISLVTALIAVKKGREFWTLREAAICLSMLMLILISGLLSATPQESLFRGFVVASSALGGFLCARILLNSPPRQSLFAWFCTFVLAGVLAVCLIGYALTGSVFEILDANPHPLADRIMLLSFGPLALAFAGRREWIPGGLGLLVAAYAVFYLMNLRSAFLIPLLLVVTAFFWGKLKLWHLAAILVPVVIAAWFFFHQLEEAKIGLEHEPAYYRAENYPFSWHIAARNPFFGIGLRSPRDTYLEDYSIKYPYVTKEKFSGSVNWVVSSENIFLTFMAELGFPFLFLYTFSLGYLLFRLIKKARSPDLGSFVHPLALFFPIGAALLHFMVLDGLLHPQISWFFHVLLGLIPVRSWIESPAPK